MAKGKGKSKRKSYGRRIRRAARKAVHHIVPIVLGVSAVGSLVTTAGPGNNSAVIDSVIGASKGNYSDLRNIPGQLTGALLSENFWLPVTAIVGIGVAKKFVPGLSSMSKISKRVSVL